MRGLCLTGLSSDLWKNQKNVSSGICTPQHTQLRRGYNVRVVSQTIFVLEDDSDIARLIRHHLEAAGFVARSFSSPAGFLQQAAAERPALFLLDIMVPGGDGRELCRAIREKPAVAMTPVVFVTAKNAEADRVAGLDLGADDYIGKPFS